MGIEYFLNEQRGQPQSRSNKRARAACAHRGVLLFSRLLVPGPRIQAMALVPLQRPVPPNYTVPYYTILYRTHLRLHLQITRRHIQIAYSADVLRTSSVACSSSSIDCSFSSIDCSFRRYTGTSSQIRLSVASRCFRERLHVSPLFCDEHRAALVHGPPFPGQ